MINNLEFMLYLLVIFGEYGKVLQKYRFKTYDKAVDKLEKIIHEMPDEAGFIIASAKNWQDFLEGNSEFMTTEERTRYLRKLLQRRNYQRKAE